MAEPFEVPPSSACDSVALSPLQSLARSVPLNVAILVGVSGYVLGVLICTSLMTSDHLRLFGEEVFSHLKKNCV